MKGFFLSALSGFFKLYLKGLALLAMVILWPISLVMWSRLSEEALWRKEHGEPIALGGFLDLDPLLQTERPAPVVEAGYAVPEPQAPITIAFSV